MRAITWAWVTGLWIGLLTGCAGSKPGALTPRQEAILDELKQIDLSSNVYRSERSTPIVDVHTHTFNARYLPIAGIGLGKRDARGLTTMLVPDAIVEAFAAILVARTQMEGPPDAAEALGPDRFGPDARIDDAIQKIERAEGLPEGTVRQDESIRALEKLLGSAPGITPTEAIRAPVELTEIDLAALKRVQPFDEPGFLKMLTLKDGPKESLYRDAHGMGPDRPLFRVTHMMDLAPVYNQPARAGTLLDFATEQVPRMERFQKSDGSSVYFVAYNPFRDHLPRGDARPGDALRIVRDAIRHRGAYGIKIYPPSGYRPIANEILSRESPRFAGEQWDARYTDGGQSIAASELDARLKALLDWCVENDVPVFAHCNHGELEARKGYGVHHADPKWWEKYLASDPPRTGKLRLCFAHAGGAAAWFGVGEHADWGQRIMRLCRKYPNVYVEFGIHDEVVESENRARFVDIVGAELAKPVPPGEYPLGSKIMYGTDWYMPGRGNRAAYLAGFEQMFLHPRLRAHYRAFFLENSLRYLNVESRLASTSSELPPPPPSVAAKMRELVAAARDDR
ncbi:MAG TPA: amidohydrolase family protein [Phycisphaerales bacterium]